MKYLSKSKYQVITENTTIPPEDFGGWQVINTGDTIATVNGVKLDPNGATVGLSFTDLPPEVIWSEDIKIVFETLVTVKQVVLTRIKYTPVTE